MKLRNIALAAAALALPSTAIILASGPSSGAATPPVIFVGTLSGNLKGTINISPPIFLTTGSTTPVKFTTRITESNLVASKGLTQKGVTITGAKASSVITTAVGTTCASLLTGFPAASFTTKYTSTGVTTAAATHFHGGTTSVSLGPPISALLGGAGTTTTGSFRNGTAGSAASTANLILDLPEATLISDCKSTTGLSKITFTGVNGASTFTFG